MALKLLELSSSNSSSSVSLNSSPRDSQEDVGPGAKEFYNEFIAPSLPTISEFRTEIKYLLTHFQPMFRSEQGSTWLPQIWGWLANDLETINKLDKFADNENYDKPLLEICTKILGKVQSLSWLEKIKLLTVKWNYTRRIEELVDLFKHHRLTINLEPPLKDAKDQSYFRLKMQLMVSQDKLKTAQTAALAEMAPTSKYKNNIEAYLQDINVKRHLITDLTLKNSAFSKEIEQLKLKLSEQEVLLQKAQTQVGTLELKLSEVYIKMKELRDENQMLRMQMQHLPCIDEERKPKQQEESVCDEEQSESEIDQLRADLAETFKLVAGLRKEVNHLTEKLKAPRHNPPTVKSFAALAKKHTNLFLLAQHELDDLEGSTQKPQKDSMLASKMCVAITSN